MKFHRPKTVNAAVKLLAADEDARCLAGGATLVAMMNADLVAPSTLVSLRHIAALRGIRKARGGVRIGAMTPHSQVAEATGLDGGQGVVASAAGRIGHPAIRNMGTIGGSISHADPAADYPAALVAANAVVEVAGPAGPREIAADAFFVDYLTTALEPGEIVTAVRLPGWGRNAAHAYEKFARVEGDFATLSCAVVLRARRGVCEDVRIALGAAAATPVRVAAAEDRLKGSRLDDADVAVASALLVAACDPVSDFRGSADYRRTLVPVLVRRALARAAGRPA